MKDFSKYSRKQLGKAYEEIVGYDPFKDDSSQSNEEVSELMVGYDDESAKNKGGRPFQEYFKNIKPDTTVVGKKCTIKPEAIKARSSDTNTIKSYKKKALKHANDVGEIKAESVGTYTVSFGKQEIKMPKGWVVILDEGITKVGEINKGDTLDNGNVKAKFSIPGQDPEIDDLVYEGYHNPEYNWNGWAVPMFDKKTAEKILKEGGFKYRIKGDKIFAVITEEDGEEELGMAESKLNGKGINLYVVGDGWVWSEVKDGDFATGGKTKQPQFSWDSFGINAYKAIKAYFKEGKPSVEVWKSLSLRDKGTNHVYRAEQTYKNVGGKVWEVVIHYYHGLNAESVGFISYNVKNDKFSYHFDMWGINSYNGKFAEGGAIESQLKGGSFQKGGSINDVMDYGESIAENMVRHYLSGVEANEVFESSEVSDIGDFNIYQERDGSGSHQCVIEICFGEKYDDTEVVIDNDYEKFSKYFDELASKGGFNSKIMSSDESKSISFVLTDPSTSTGGDSFADGGQTGTHKYKLGDKWRSDFDADGMFKMALESNDSWSADKWKKMYDSLVDNNYHTPAGIAWEIFQFKKEGKDITDKIKDFHTAVNKEVESGGAIDLPFSVSYLKIAPLRVGDPFVYTRISPDKTGDFIAGYVVYKTPSSTKKAGYLSKDELAFYLQTDQYEIIDKNLIPVDKFEDGGVAEGDNIAFKDIGNVSRVMSEGDSILVRDAGGNSQVIPVSRIMEKFSGGGILLKGSSFQKGGETKSGELPEIVSRAVLTPVFDIGQLTKEQIRDLDKYVKKGLLVKGKGGSYPVLKTGWALTGFDFDAVREESVGAMLKTLEKLEPGTVKKIGKDGKVVKMEDGGRTDSPEITYSEFAKNKPILYGQITVNDRSKIGSFRSGWNKYTNSLQYQYYSPAGKKGTGGFTLKRAFDLLKARRLSTDLEMGDPKNYL